MLAKRNAVNEGHVIISKPIAIRVIYTISPITAESSDDNDDDDK